MTTLWGGRFERGPAPEMLAFTESLSFDVALVGDDCRVLAAHARALARAGILSEEAAREVERTLDSVAADIAAGRFAFQPTDEDVHTAVERALLARLPDVAPHVRAGLSRNDRVATALRLWLAREGGSVVAALADLVEVLVARAREHRDDLLPGYTHLQRAQPVTLGHHLAAHAFALTRDSARLLDALDRANASPLGAGALAGSTLGLDVPPEDLGLREAMPNSLDAVSARDFVAEFLAAGAILGTHLSRLGEELTLWTSAEFGFAAFDDAYATGSSLMPQKKNPDVAELVRGKAGRLIGDLTGLLATLKGLPLSYNRDLQEDKEPLFDAVRTLRMMLPALAGALRTLRFDTGRMAAAAGDGSLLATDLAERLVRGGMPFREAHAAVGELAKRAAVEGLDLGELAAKEHGQTLDAAASVAARGAPGPASVAAQLERLDAAVAAVRSRLG
ncbi:MAG TPA: argininosuccinate lyase [Actinomycetota bacterium]